MKSLRQFLLEAKEESKGFIIKTKEEAYKYFGVKPDSDAGKFISALYDNAPINSKTGEITSPFVGDYKGESNNFALRRWVKNDPEITELISKVNIKQLFNTENKTFTFKDYHDTRLEQIDDFPNSSDQEYILALSLNIKSLGENNIDKALKYALFGDADKKLNDEEKELFDKYNTYYKENKDLVNKYSKNYKFADDNSDDPELFTKCTNAEVKNDVSDDWRENGNYKRNPNYTPKTDLKSNKGKKLSVKNSDGAQAMSGGVNETMATLMTYADLLDEEERKKLQQLFYDEKGNEINWKGNNKERNEKLNSIIKGIFKDKEKNKDFILAVLTESITGAGKFGADSTGTAEEVMVWSSDGEMESYDVEKYIYAVFNQISEKDITINHKSSSSTYACLRLNLPKHLNIKDSLDNYNEDKADKATLERIRSIRSNEYHKEMNDKKSNDDKPESDEGKKVRVKDPSGSEIDVIIHVGPEGGLFYYQHGKPKTDENKVYVKKGHDGKIVPRKSNK